MPAPVELTVDPLKSRGNPALEQRPIKTESKREIAAVDHRIGLLGGARSAADRHAAFENAGLGSRNQRLNLRIVDLAALADGGGEIPRPDDRNVDAGRRQDLVDAVDRFYMLD